jgi:mannose-1-phosphate guanylyltransferase/mannose-6-phosphate isomerase
VTTLRRAAAAPSARRIARFVEKPDLATAQAYLDDGSYLWNSGLFMMRASVWLAAIGNLPRRHSGGLPSGLGAGSRDGEFLRVGKDAFAACPSDSIDYAVMERIARRRHAGRPAPGVVIPLQAGWSDVGAWDALWEVLPKDDDGNVARAT